MKVLHVITGLGIGGAEQQLRLMLRHLPLRSAVVTLTNPGAVADGIEADGTPVTHLGMTGNRDAGALPRLTRLIRQGGYDLVHTHLYRACVYGRPAARLAGVRSVIATEHSLGEAQIEGRPLSAGTRALYLATERLGTSTVAVSPSVARRLTRWGVAPSRISVVPNGIETNRFAFDPRARASARAALGLPPNAFVVGGVGRLAPGKRFDRLVRAVAAVPEARLLLVGEGDQREQLLRVAEECGAKDRVLLAGACEDPPAGPSGPTARETGAHAAGPAGPEGSAGPADLAGPVGPEGLGGLPASAGPVGPEGLAGIPASARPEGPVDLAASAALSDSAASSGRAGATGGRPGLPAMLAAMDVFVSTSPDETFGLAVVEALAAGLPALYVACPAIDDLPAEAAPGARRIGESVPELISALLALRDSGHGRLAPPEAVRRYDIAQSARKLMSLYHQAVHGPTPVK
ncbi:glycosyltransferase [Streptomyces sp. NPDC012637]|uniref:glycosyltransferase n=1 Tax=Streptomyces sp. NPDC012637 TaxID=3364842 RepID=UPI0036E9FA9C